MTKNMLRFGTAFYVGKYTTVTYSTHDDFLKVCVTFSLHDVPHNLTADRQIYVHTRNG